MHVYKLNQPLWKNSQTKEITKFGAKYVTKVYKQTMNKIKMSIFVIIVHILEL